MGFFAFINCFSLYSTCIISSSLHDPFGLTKKKGDDVVKSCNGMIVGGVVIGGGKGVCEGVQEWLVQFSCFEWLVI